MNTNLTYLTVDQVQKLNEKHGWFQYRDGQSGVSRAFAQDAIAMHEAMRAAAPQMFAALLRAEGAVAELCQDQHPDNTCWEILGEIQAALKAAEAAQ